MTEEEKMKKNYPLRMTQKEREFLAKIAEVVGTNESNTIRRALRLLAEQNGIELPVDVFNEKSGGNWLPKESRVTGLNQHAAPSTGIGVPALVPAL